MWFDDDSYIKHELPVDPWLDSVRASLQTSIMAGEPWRKGLEGNQAAWIEAQPWYTGKDVRKPGYETNFLTGGWWTLRTKFIYDQQWPWPELKHRGGDVMLGELLRQQSLGMVKCSGNVGVNRGLDGKTAQRRGYDEKPIGYYYARRDAAQQIHVLEPPQPVADYVYVETVPGSISKMLAAQANPLLHLFDS
jgi:hypothetical protein